MESEADTGASVAPEDGAGPDLDALDVPEIDAADIEETDES
jgi:hypothetical protein